MVLETYMKLCVRELDFPKKIFLPPPPLPPPFSPSPPNWENGPKTGFFEFTENFGHQFLLNFFNKKIIICCVPAQMRYLGKFVLCS